MIYTTSHDIPIVQVNYTLQVDPQLIQAGLPDRVDLRISGEPDSDSSSIKGVASLMQGGGRTCIFTQAVIIVRTYIIYTMVMSYIKGTDRCIFTHIHLCTGCMYYIYTSDTLCSPDHEERFTSTNSRSISSDCYRETKFSAKMTFVIFTSDSPQYLLFQLTTNLSGSIEKQTFHSVQPLLSSVEKAEI